MSVKDFNSYQAVSILEGDSHHLQLAKITPTSSFQLEHIVALLYFKGTFTTEKFSLKLHTQDQDFSQFFAQSNELNASDLHSGTDTLVWARFDFSKIEMSNGFDYFLTIQGNGYARNADIKFLGLVHNWSHDFHTRSGVYNVNDLVRYPKAIQIFGRV